MKRIKNKFIKKNLKELLVVIVLYSFFFNGIQSSIASNFEYTIVGRDKINISKESFLRLEEYRKGRFYSKVYDTKIFNVTGLYFALSETGNAVALSFCEDGLFDCNTGLLKYQTRLTCEKISKETCNIIAINQNLILNKKILPMNDEKEIENFFIIDSKRNKPGISYEIRAQSYKDFDDDYE